MHAEKFEEDLTPEADATEAKTGGVGETEVPVDEGLPLNQARVFGLSAAKKARLAAPGLVALVAFAIALVMDLLSFEHRIGLQWAIFVNLLLAGAVGLALAQRKALPWQSWLLAGLTSLLAILSAVRSEGRTVTGLTLLSFSGLVILAISFLNGQWMAYRVREHLVGRVKLIFSGVTAVPAALIEAYQARNKPEEEAGKGRGLVKALLIGLTIALPFVTLLGVLLAGADEAFRAVLGNFLSWVSFDNLNEIFIQVILVGVLTWIIFGMYAHAFTESAEKAAIEPDRPLFRPFLGSTEAAVVLGSVNLLFALFLFVQFRYFFAGQAAVDSLGLTYSSYAVKGFNELIMVACLVLFIHYVLASVTRRQTQRERRLFSVLATLMVLQVGVVLLSAHSRLALYEQMYGFTQLRLVSHLFIPFVAIVLAASVWMELKRGFRYMALVLFGSAAAFGLCLALVNVDATIARLNLGRAQAGLELDHGHLIQELSEDALPVMVRVWQDGETNAALREELGAVLACRAGLFETKTASEQPWWAYDAAESYALRTYPALKADLPPLATEMSGRDNFAYYTIEIKGQSYGCGYPATAEGQSD